jgi:hypothetical protein
MRIEQWGVMLALVAVFLVNPIVGPSENLTWVNGMALADEMDAAPAPTSPSADETTAAPSDVTKPPQEAGDAITSVVKNVRSGNWKLAVAALLSLLMTVLAKARSVVPFFRGDRGGSVLVMVLALMGSFATALSLGGSIDLNLVLSAIGVAFTAVGGWTWVNQVVRPADKKKPA